MAERVAEEWQERCYGTEGKRRQKIPELYWETKKYISEGEREVLTQTANESKMNKYRKLRP